MDFWFNHYFCRPALIVENIPGLELIGNQKKPNTKIRVEHILKVHIFFNIYYIIVDLIN